MKPKDLFATQNKRPNEMITFTYKDSKPLAWNFIIFDTVYTKYCHTKGVAMGVFGGGILVDQLTLL